MERCTNNNEKLTGSANLYERRNNFYSQSWNLYEQP